MKKGFFNVIVYYTMASTAIIFPIPNFTGSKIMHQW